MKNIIFPWATQFVANCKRQHGCLSDSAQHAILNNRPLNRAASVSFTWDETPQGWNYWYEVDTHIR